MVEQNISASILPSYVLQLFEARIIEQWEQLNKTYEGM